MATQSIFAENKPAKENLFYPHGDGSNCSESDLNKITPDGQLRGILVSPREYQIADPQERFDAMVTRLFADKPGYRERFNCQWYDSGMMHLLITPLSKVYLD